MTAVCAVSAVHTQSTEHPQRCMHTLGSRTTAQHTVLLVSLHVQYTISRFTALHLSVPGGCPRINMYVVADVAPVH